MYKYGRRSVFLIIIFHPLRNKCNPDIPKKEKKKMLRRKLTPEQSHDPFQYKCN
jgi:hypothetical protein